jgi:hypothetical protein
VSTVSTRCSSEAINLKASNRLWVMVKLRILEFYQVSPVVNKKFIMHEKCRHRELKRKIWGLFGSTSQYGPL